MITPARDFGYAEAVKALEDALVFGTNPSLRPIREVASSMGEPQRAFRAIQVAGTNGKSSVARMTATILRERGVRTGLFTSPHLLHYRERIEIEGEMLEPDTFAWCIHNALKADRELIGANSDRQPATEFELLTAAALWAFRENHVEVAVFEVGMGGRWDATSVVDPDVAVITGVALDHTRVLGTTRELIATEKAQVIKESTRAIVLGPGIAGVEQEFLGRLHAGQELVVVAEPSADLVVPSSAVFEYEVSVRPDSPTAPTRVRLRPPVSAGDQGEGATIDLDLAAPAYQAGNAALAHAAAAAYLGDNVSEPTGRALSAVELPGRFQRLANDPHLLVDVAHNPDAAAALAGAIRDAWPTEEERPVLAISVFDDKDVEGMLRVLDKVVFEFAVIGSDHSRSRPAHEVAEIIWNITGEQPVVAPTVEDAILYARGKGVDMVITGGHAVVGDTMMTLRREA